MLPFHQLTDFDLCHKFPATVLSLLVLGNMVTTLINTRIAPAQRQAIANSFARALQSSINEDKAH